MCSYCLVLNFTRKSNNTLRQKKEKNISPSLVTDNITVLDIQKNQAQ